MTPNRKQTSFQTRCERIAKTIDIPDTHKALKRITALIEDGELGESILRRLNGPAKAPPKSYGWFVGD